MGAPLGCLGGRCGGLIGAWLPGKCIVEAVAAGTGAVAQRRICCVGRLVRILQSVQDRPVKSSSIDCTLSSHLGLIRCLTLILRVSTRRRI